MIWCCPTHWGPLISDNHARLRAECCGATFPVVAGIPDLRIAQAAWVDRAEDRQRAEELAAAVPPDDVAGTVRFVFGRRPGWTAAQVERRVEQVLTAADRLREEREAWLAPVMEQSGPILDLGCGPGMLLAAMGGTHQVLGLDVSLEWLVVADRMARAAGVTPALAAGHAEALPLASGTVGAVAALDVLEHVGDQVATIREIDRVLAPGGVLAAATPNRFSLGAEPHVGVWGVGWLPRAWQAGYVRRRTGMPYAFTRLLSARELQDLLHRHSTLAGSLAPAAVPSAELSRMSGRRRALAKTYNALLGWSVFRVVARSFGPFFQLIATKPGLPATN